MKLISFVVILLFASLSYSQVLVEDININELDIQYCQVVATGKPFSNKVKINIDYGQESKFFGKKNSQVKDTQGNAIKFNSVFDAINFMASNGWEMVFAFPITVDGGMGGKQHVYHYTFKKQQSTLNPEEFITAQIEIAKGISRSLSSIEPKTAIKKDDWDKLLQAYNDDMGWMG